MEEKIINKINKCEKGMYLAMIVIMIVNTIVSIVTKPIFFIFSNFAVLAIYIISTYYMYKIWEKVNDVFFEEKIKELTKELEMED